MEVNIKLDNLRNRLLELESVTIAYSGGVDSNFLLKVAKDTLGDKCYCSNPSCYDAFR